jgi:hypothetical protein
MIQNMLNKIPMKRHRFKTPSETLHQSLNRVVIQTRIHLQQSINSIAKLLFLIEIFDYALYEAKLIN